MKKVKKRLSLFLVLIMVIGLLPVNAFAEDGEEAVPVIQMEDVEETVPVIQLEDVEEAVPVIQVEDVEEVVPVIQVEENTQEEEVREEYGEQTSESFESPDLKDGDAAEPASDENGTKSGEAFTAIPENVSVVPDGTCTLSWTTNFTPVKVEIVAAYNHSYSFNDTVIAEVSSGMSRSMSKALTYNQVYNARGYFDSNNDYYYLTGWYLRAYYDNNFFVTSDDFTIDYTSRAFTAIPEDVSVDPDDTCTLSWTTNFTPVKVEIVAEYNHSYSYNSTVIAEVSSGMSRSMSKALTYNQVYNARQGLFCKGGIYPHRINPDCGSFVAK